MAWQCVSPEVTVKGVFKRCFITNAVDETDDKLWNGCDEDRNV